MKANEILKRAAEHMQDRAATYDKQDGERSIGATVAAFNAVTGDGLMNSEERGWLFMSLLKKVRSQQGEYRADNYEDDTAYSSLQGEAAARERGPAAKVAGPTIKTRESEDDNPNQWVHFIPGITPRPDHEFIDIQLVNGHTITRIRANSVNFNAVGNDAVTWYRLSEAKKEGSQ